MTLQATFAATLVDEWARAGVTEAVIAPGSRSSPLALALAADHRLRIHVHLDERSAGFFALGLGLATGRPAVVVTTSGTAAVELHPAVVEAHHARVPLLACTADRPPELQGVGAPQTVDQVHLFGPAVRWFAAPGVPAPKPVSWWRSLASRAVAEATVGAGGPGPVHLNLAFREPLVGEAAPLPPGRPDGAPWHRTAPAASAAPPPDADLVARLAGARRGLVVAGRGAGDPEAVTALAARGWPVLADPLSGCRRPARGVVGAFDALLRAEPFAAAQRPDVVVRLGAPPASRVLATWLAGLDAHQVVVDVHGGWWDPDRCAASVVAGDPGRLCRALAEAVAAAAVDPTWAAGWAGAEAAAQAAFDRVLADHPEPTEPGVARAVAAALPAGATLVVSSSMPVRDVEWYARPRPGLRVLANRGANGIDGVTSTALGVAAASSGPTAALLGDLAFLHDGGGRLWAGRGGVDCALVVVDNDGGGIFEFLPQAAGVGRDRFELLFGTPHGLDLAALAAAHGLAVEEVAAAADVAPALARATAAGGGAGVVLARTDRRANVTVHEELHREVAAALESPGVG